MPVVIQDLANIEQDFNTKLCEYLTIIDALPFSQDNTIDNNIANNIIAEGIFIRFFTLWENAIENCFIYFCQGGSTLNNKQPICRLASCDKESVRKILLNNQRYLDWSNYGVIKKRADMFFENGMPFYDAVTGNSNVLSDVEKIRNVIAHDSLESWIAYNQVLINKFNTSPSFKMSPGQMLRIRDKSKRKSWGKYYFNEIINTFTAILRPK